jgi:hypothetical protein
MNAAHKIGKLKNRLNRLKKRLADKDLPSDQRSRVTQRLAELESQVGS